MEKFERKQRAAYDVLLDVVVTTALSFTRVGEPQPDSAKKAIQILVDAPAEARQRTLAICMAYAVAAFPPQGTGTQLMQQLATLLGKDLPTTTANPRPVIDLILLRKRMREQFGDSDTLTHGCRMIRLDGALTLSVAGWTACPAAMDLAYAYHMTFYWTEDLSDQIALMRFVAGNCAQLSPSVLADFATRHATMVEYLECGTGLPTQVLSPHALRELGARLVEVEAFERLVQDGYADRDRLANLLVKRGFLQALPAGMRHIDLPDRNDDPTTLR